MVEIGAGQVRAFAQRQFEGSEIAGRFRHFRGGVCDDSPERIEGGGIGGAVEDFFAGAPVLDQACALELCELGRDARLSHRKDLLQFSNREFVLAQEPEQPQPGWVRDELEGFQEKSHDEESEIRNPKSETNSKLKFETTRDARAGCSSHLRRMGPKLMSQSRSEFKRIIGFPIKVVKLRLSLRLVLDSELRIFNLFRISDFGFHRTLVVV